MKRLERNVVALAILSVVLTLTASRAAAREVMTDRCSAEVAIVPSYGARPDTPGTIILKRAPNGSTDWTPPFNVQLGASGHIRWWCHSTTGNFLDPGTWR